MSLQTLIPIGISDDLGLDNFHGQHNQILIEELKTTILGQRQQSVIYFWGESGSGKSHLLHGCCQLANSISKPYYYLPLGQSISDSLADLASNVLLAIDDFQLAVGKPQLQNQLLALYQKLIAQGQGAMIIAANESLASLNIALKDLHSRLSSGGIFNTEMLDDKSKRLALSGRAAGRGIILEDSVLDFIMSHYQRDTVSLFSLLDKLDSASLQSHRKITIPFLKTLL